MDATCQLCSGKGLRSGNCPSCGRREVIPGKRVLLEEKDRETIDAWFKTADEMTLEKLPAFLTCLTTEYQHDYGTICHAIVAAGVAAMKAIDRSPIGGITGFQAGCIMWGVIDRWMGETGPKRILKFDDMLYPQSVDRFARKISKATWEYLQKRARELLLSTGSQPVHPDVIAHWKMIIGGRVPFGFTVEAA